MSRRWWLLPVALATLSACGAGAPAATPALPAGPVSAWTTQDSFRADPMAAVVAPATPGCGGPGVAVVATTSGVVTRPLDGGQVTDVDLPLPDPTTELTGDMRVVNQRDGSLLLVAIGHWRAPLTAPPAWAASVGGDRAVLLSWTSRCGDRWAAAGAVDAAAVQGGACAWPQVVPGLDGPPRSRWYGGFSSPVLSVAPTDGTTWMTIGCRAGSAPDLPGHAFARTLLFARRPGAGSWGEPVTSVEWPAPVGVTITSSGRLGLARCTGGAVELITSTDGGRTLTRLTLAPGGTGPGCRLPSSAAAGQQVRTTSVSVSRAGADAVRVVWVDTDRGRGLLRGVDVTFSPGGAATLTQRGLVVPEGDGSVVMASVAEQQGGATLPEQSRDSATVYWVEYSSDSARDTVHLVRARGGDWSPPRQVDGESWQPQPSPPERWAGDAFGGGTWRDATGCHALLAWSGVDPDFSVPNLVVHTTAVDDPGCADTTAPALGTPLPPTPAPTARATPAPTPTPRPTRPVPTRPGAARPSTAPTPS